MSVTPLPAAPLGVALRIAAIAPSALLTRMQSMGIRAGAEITVIAKAAAGVRIIRVGDARISLAKPLCRLITVTPAEAADVR